VNKLCSKIDTCYKINMIRDKDILDFQFAEAVREVCGRCEDFTAVEVREMRLLTEKEIAEVLHRKVDEIYIVPSRLIARAQAELTRKDDMAYFHGQLKHYLDTVPKEDMWDEISGFVMSLEGELEALKGS